jgi:hypothetical protein
MTKEKGQMDKQHKNVHIKLKIEPYFIGYVNFMVSVFNATLSNMSVISWRQFNWWWKQECLQIAPICRMLLANFIT